MKLELKHLAPYLPYGLMCKWNQSIPYKLKGLQKGNDSVNNELWVWLDGRHYMTGYLYECKPILRPLSDLTGQTKKAKELIMMVSEDSEYSTDAVKMTLRRSRTGMFVGIYEVLLKYHFDVFGLIPEGLAIDINTLEK